MTPREMETEYGGDGTILGSAQAFYDQLDKLGEDGDLKSKVKDKRMVFFWAKKEDGEANVHETLAHSAAQGWETLPDKASVGYYACKHPDMGEPPKWPQEGAGWLQAQSDAGVVPPPMRKPAGRPPSTVWTTNNPF